MTKANGFNYDWSTGNRSDLRYKNKYVFIIETPVNQPFEMNISDKGGINSFQYRNTRKVNFVARIKSSLTVVNEEMIISENDDALDLALKDIRTKFCGNVSTELCSQGTQKIKYVTGTKRALPAKGVYYPYDLVATFEIEYIESRC
jgi:hypothetical protein